MSETRQRILDDVKKAMKAGEKDRLGTLRLITAAIKQREVDERKETGEQEVLEILDKMLKQRRESISQYTKAGRDDLTAVEEKEIVVISEYMPAALSDAEINELIGSTITETGASSIKDMGEVMAKLKPLMQGKADMSEVSASVKNVLTGS